jgi:hypothetical protein
MAMQHLPQMRHNSDFRFADNRFFIPSTSLKELSKQGEYNRFGSAHELAPNGEPAVKRLRPNAKYPAR